jgi:hypothetical protein
MMLDRNKATTIVFVKGVCLLTDLVFKNQKNHPKQVSSSARLTKRRIRILVRTTLSVVYKLMKF